MSNVKPLKLSQIKTLINEEGLLWCLQKLVDSNRIVDTEMAARWNEAKTAVAAVEEYLEDIEPEIED